MQSRSRPGLRWSWAIWECPDRRPSGPVSLGKSGTWTGTAGFGLVQTGSQSVRDRTSPTLFQTPCPASSTSSHSQWWTGIWDFQDTGHQDQQPSMCLQTIVPHLLDRLWRHRQRNLMDPCVMITMDFGISPGCYQVGGVKTLNYSGNSVVRWSIPANDPVGRW